MRRFVDISYSYNSDGKVTVSLMRKKCTFFLLSLNLKKNPTVVLMGLQGFAARTTITQEELNDGKCR